MIGKQEKTKIGRIDYITYLLMRSNILKIDFLEEIVRFVFVNPSAAT